MTLEEITLRNWRAYREAHVFRFQEGVNLLVGRNEAGKSTLFEALTRALFDRHTSKTEEIRALQPLGSSLGAEVSVLFRSDNTRCKVVKRFLQDPKSEFYSERGGQWELDHEGDQADAHLRDVLRGEATARTAARPEHRGLAQALWYLQSDSAIPEKAWNDGVNEGLQGLVQIATTSPHERAILEAVKHAYQEYWTPTGRIATASELGRLRAEAPELEEDLAKLQDQARVVEGYRTDLEEFRKEEAQKRLELTKSSNELAKLAERVAEARQIEQEKEARERTQTKAAEVAIRLRQEIAQIEEKQKKIAAWKREIQQLEDEVTDTSVEAKQEAAEVERHARRCTDELEPALKQAEEELGWLRAAANLRKLEKERERLEKHLGKVSAIRDKLEEREKESADLLAPTAKERRRFNKALTSLSIVDAQIEASGVRVGFDWGGKPRKITTRPALQKTESGDFIVAEPTEFRVQGVGKIHVRSGAQALKDLLTQQSKLHKEVTDTLQHFNAEDADGLAALFEEGQELSRTVTKLERDLEEAMEAQPDAPAELTRIKRGIEEESLAAAKLASTASERTGSSIREEIASKEIRKDSLIREIKKEQGHEKKSQQRHLDLLEAREASSIKRAERRAQTRTHEEAIAEILKAYGTLDHLNEQAVGADEALANAQAAHEDILKDYEERVETPKKLHLQMQERVKEFEGQLGDLRTEVAGTLARIEESAAQGNYSQLADLEIEVDRKRRRLDVLHRRAEGAKLLQNLVAAHQRQRSAALSGPIQDLTNRWLAILTQGGYDTLRIDEALRPAGVHVTRYSADLPLTSLSYGTQEQVVVLLRLAIGVLVSRDDRNLVVIDDRLVNADPVRMTRLGLIIQEAAETCQVMIATCNDTPYAGMGANIVRIPSDGVQAVSGS